MKQISDLTEEEAKALCRKHAFTSAALESLQEEHKRFREAVAWAIDYLRKDNRGYVAKRVREIANGGRIRSDSKTPCELSEGKHSAA